jgi:hypothetical protein
VNCVDCLDRTNVVQGLLGRHALEGLLAQLGLLGPGEELAAVLPQVRAIPSCCTDDRVCSQIILHVLCSVNGC